MRLGPIDNTSDDSDRSASRARASRRSNTCPRVLIVAATQARRDALTNAMRQDDVICTLAENPESALSLLDHTGAKRAATTFGVVVIDIQRCSAATLRFVRELGERSMPAVIVCPSVSFDEAVEAMRAGACDIVSSTIKPRDLLRRVRSALSQPRQVAVDEPASSSPIATPESLLPTTPATSEPRRKARAIKPADRAKRDVIDAAELADDFSVLIRSELDVESLLRQALEFILAHGGPTNAAVFLPATSGDFSLGAYVNYTCPKDAAEILLDHLANVAAPRLESITDVVHMTTPDHIAEHIGEGIDWMLDHHVLAFSCRHEGECLALFMLFRESGTPFDPQFIKLVSLLSERFASQLAKVVRIHHRHLPRERWGTLGTGAGDDGLAN